MRNWKRDDAQSAIAGFNLRESNLEVAEYWLSLWDGDTPPQRHTFNPARIVGRLPAIALFEVRVGESACCRLAGSLYRLGLGMELTGRDLLALTPKHQRRERIRSVGAIVEGAVMRANRPVLDDDGETVVTEELYLPLGGISENGTRRYLMHTDWKPRRTDNFPDGLARTNASLPLNRAISPIRKVDTSR